ncbi:hypothetical protein ACVWWI_000076 [Bradyrhizobium sp. USDA 3686]|nr:hypothetical protein [Bradyrhizobium canariense]
MFSPEPFQFSVRFQTIGDILASNSSDEGTYFDPQPTPSSAIVVFCPIPGYYAARTVTRNRSTCCFSRLLSSDSD